MKKSKSDHQSTVIMPLVNSNAAGIDVGDTIHAVAVPADRDETPVRTFGTMTCDLEAIAAWLKACQVDTIAMESTGIYWKPLFSLLVQSGFEVYLVNAKQVRNVSGRKNDEDDARWIQKLHSCGLLQSSYLPDSEQEALRTLVRHRRTLMMDRSRCVFRMQKALEMMNVKLHTLIRDITGKTGTLIIEAIIRGDRKPEHFLACIDRNIRADRATILKSLQGNWREEQLYLLADCYACYQYYTGRIACCDTAIERQLQQFQNQLSPEIQSESETKPPKKATKNKPGFNTCNYLKAIHGIDVMAIYGISDIAALELLAETGTDMSKWPSAKHFVSWLNLCPNNKISGESSSAAR
jgi:transposase